jgi:hypothetical protein
MAGQVSGGVVDHTHPGVGIITDVGNRSQNSPESKPPVSCPPETYYTEISLGEIYPLLASPK